MLRPMTVRLALLAAVVLAAAGCGDASDVAGRGLVGPATEDGSCPATFPAEDGPWVPEVPTAETEGRLVPDADPVLAHICRYEAGSNTGERVPLELAGEVDVTDGLNVVRRDLHLPALLDGSERACTLAGGPLVPHLVRFDYADGSVWVSATQEPNSCNDSGNGAFTTGVPLGDLLAEAFDTGRWPAAPEPQRCYPGTGGRAGQEQQLVPDGWTSIAVCRPGLNDPGPPPRPLDPDTADRVVALLNSADLAPNSGGCSGGDNTRYDLLVRYDRGNAVNVGVNIGCDPPLRNGSLDGVLAPQDQAALQDLLQEPS
jgi:hypothetical protein